MEALAKGVQTHPDSPIQGGGYLMPVLPHLTEIPLEGFRAISGQQARDAVRILACPEGILAGFSAGANLAAALDLLNGPEIGCTIAIVACDSGLKYLSTDLWR